MTHGEWLTSTNPAAMLEFLIGHNANLAEGVGGGEYVNLSERKLRLIAGACYAEAARSGKANRDIAAEAANDALQWADLGQVPTNGYRNMPMGHEGGEPIGGVEHAKSALTWAGSWWANKAALANILRDLIGDPWHKFPTLRWSEGVAVEAGQPQQPTVARCLPWLTPTVRDLSESAYVERRPDGTLDPERLGVLADALEESGCTEERVLIHLRGFRRVVIRSAAHMSAAALESGASEEVVWLPTTDPHYRGCATLDYLTGRE